jgi:uncharacterized protein (DUF305 family)
MKYLTLFLILSVVGGFACSMKSTVNDSHSTMNHNGMNHSEMNHQSINHAQMNHSDMKSSPNAASASYDLQFLDTMIVHHQGAVDMAKPAETKAEHTELKNLAKSIIADQEKEIVQMKKWRNEWFAGKPAAMNMEMSGMADSMKGMDMQKLDTLYGNNYDIEFISQMIPHHTGAVVMAKEALQKSQKEQIKTLASAIIKSQEAEIKQMKEWQTNWSK